MYKREGVGGKESTWSTRFWLLDCTLSYQMIGLFIFFFLFEWRINLSLFAISGSAHEAELTFGVKPLSSTLLVHDYCRICFLSSLPFILHHFDVVSLSFLVRVSVDNVHSLPQPVP